MHFRDPIWVLRIRQSWVSETEIGSLQVHTRYVTFSIKKPAVDSFWIGCTVLNCFRI